ncbi:MAG: glutathione-regulated potassium-efflux system ancillary protein KefG [Psychrobacter glaciei]|jgi:glutathione-regulated potassium-efflux system ancillary protein KefG
MSKVLILFAHPSQSRSEINIPLFNASNIQGVTLVDLYNEYPNYRINIQLEQKRLIEHDIIIFMFPLYWYSTPAILKEWQDLVLEYGFAYGHNGDSLTGKKFLCATSAGGPKNAYQSAGVNHFSINELLQPLEQMASLCNMQYLPPYVLFGARTALEENRIDSHIQKWKALLTSMVNDEFDFKLVDKTRLLNSVDTSIGIDK